MSEAVYNIFIYLLEMLIAFAFYSKNYKRRITSNPAIFFIGIILFFSAALLFIFFNNEVINLSIFFIINFLFGFICFDIPVKSAIIQSIILDAIMYCSELITIFSSSAIMGYPTNTYKNNFIAYIILSSISKIIYLIFSQVLSFVIKKDNFATFKIKYFLPLFIFPFLTLVTCTVFLFLALETEMSAGYQIAVFVISTLFIFTCIFMFIYYQMLLEKEMKISELESEKKINNLNETYLNILQHQNEELQMMFHDTKHHYMTLSNLDSLDDVRAYIEKLNPDLENKNKVCISSNKVIDLILNKYIVICKTKGIKFNYEVKTADLSYIDNVELSAILNNALDNAVESAQNSVEKIIEFSIRHINNMDLLSIVNSCDIAPKHKYNQLISTKKFSKGHGFGNRIIERHTKANNGKYEWFYDEEKKEFHLSLLFQKKMQLK